MTKKPKILSRAKFEEVFAKLREIQDKKEFKRRLKYGKPKGNTRPPAR